MLGRVVFIKGEGGRKAEDWTGCSEGEERVEGWMREGVREGKRRTDA